ncbi:hypothetical protein HDK77DRAFT_107978 [Phyllosticta capitalensis]
MAAPQRETRWVGRYGNYGRTDFTYLHQRHLAAATHAAPATGAVVRKRACRSSGCAVAALPCTCSNFSAWELGYSRTSRQALCISPPSPPHRSKQLGSRTHSLYRRPLPVCVPTYPPAHHDHHTESPSLPSSPSPPSADACRARAQLLLWEEGSLPPRPAHPPGSPRMRARTHARAVLVSSIVSCRCRSRSSCQPRVASDVGSDAWLGLADVCKEMQIDRQTDRQMDRWAKKETSE